MSDDWQISDLFSDYVRLPTPVRNRVAEVIGNAYADAYRSVFPEDTQLEHARAFWAGRYDAFAPKGETLSSTERSWLQRKAQELRSQVTSTPLSERGADFRLIQFNMPKNRFGAESERYAAGASALGQSQTIGDLQNTLLRAMQPGIAALSERMARKYKYVEPAEMVNAGVMGVLQAMPAYQKTYIDKQGKERKSNFTSFAMHSGAMGGMRSAIRSGSYTLPTKAELSLEANDWTSEIVGGGQGFTDVERAAHEFGIIEHNGGLMLTHLYSQGGTVFDPAGNLRRFSYEPKEGFKSVFVSPDDLTQVAGVMAGDDDELDLSSGMLRHYLTEAKSVFDTHSNAYEPPTAKVPDADTVAMDLQRNAMHHMPDERIPSGLFVQSRDRRAVNFSEIARPPDQEVPYLIGKRPQRYPWRDHRTSYLPQRAKDDEARKFSKAQMKNRLTPLVQRPFQRRPHWEQVVFSLKDVKALLGGSVEHWVNDRRNYLAERSGDDPISEDPSIVKAAKEADRLVKQISYATNSVGGSYDNPINMELNAQEASVEAMKQRQAAAEVAYKTPVIPTDVSTTVKFQRNVGIRVDLNNPNAPLVNFPAMFPIRNPKAVEGTTPEPVAQALEPFNREIVRRRLHGAQAFWSNVQTWVRGHAEPLELTSQNIARLRFAAVEKASRRRGINPQFTEQTISALRRARPMAAGTDPLAEIGRKDIWKALAQEPAFWQAHEGEVYASGQIIRRRVPIWDKDKTTKLTWATITDGRVQPSALAGLAQGSLDMGIPGPLPTEGGRVLPYQQGPVPAIEQTLDYLFSDGYRDGSGQAQAEYTATLAGQLLWEEQQHDQQVAGISPFAVDVGMNAAAQRLLVKGSTWGYLDDVMGDPQKKRENAVDYAEGSSSLQRLPVVQKGFAQSVEAETLALIETGQYGDDLEAIRARAEHNVRTHQSIAARKMAREMGVPDNTPAVPEPEMPAGGSSGSGGPPGEDDFFWGSPPPEDEDPFGADMSNVPPYQSPVSASKGGRPANRAAAQAQNRTPQAKVQNRPPARRRNTKEQNRMGNLGKATPKERGVAMQTASNFAKSLKAMGLKVNVPTVRNAGKTTIAFYDKNAKGVFLTERYLSDQYWKSANAADAHGADTSVQWRREATLAHEYGHQFETKGLTEAVKKWWDEHPESRERTMARVNKLPADHAYRQPGGMIPEIVADIGGAVFGRPKARLQNMYGMTPEEITNFSMVAIDAMVQEGRIPAEVGERLKEQFRTPEALQSTVLEEADDIPLWDDWEREPPSEGVSPVQQEGQPEPPENFPPEPEQQKFTAAETSSPTAAAQTGSHQPSRWRNQGEPATRSRKAQSTSRPHLIDWDDYKAQNPKPKTSPATVGVGAVNSPHKPRSKKEAAEARARADARRAKAGGASDMREPASWSYGRLLEYTGDDPAVAEELQRRQAARRRSLEERLPAIRSAERNAMVLRYSDEISVNTASKIHHRSLGGMRVLETDDARRPTRIRFVAPERVSDEGEQIAPERETLSAEMVDTAVNLAKSAWGRAHVEPVANPNSMDEISTVNNRLKKYIKEYVNNWTKKAIEAAGNDPEQIALAKETGEKLKLLAEKLIENPVQSLASTLKGNDPHSTAYDWKDAAYRPTYLNKVEDMEMAMRRDPVLARQIQQAYGSAEKAMQSPDLQVVSGQGGGYQFGGGGSFGGGENGRGSGGRGNNIWSGPVGSFLYGSYLAKRFWSMTAAPVFRNMDAYAKEQAGLAPLAFAGDPSSMDMGYSAGGYMARQYQAQMRMGKGAYEVWGPIADLGAAMTEGPLGPYMSRLTATGLVAGGMGAAGFVMGNTGILGSMAGMMGMDAAGATAAGQRLAPMLGYAGAFAGGLGLGFEGYQLGTDLGLLPDAGIEPGLGGSLRFAGRFNYAMWRGAAGLWGVDRAKMDQGFNEAFPGVMRWLVAPNMQQASNQKEIEAMLSELGMQTGLTNEEAAPMIYSAFRAFGGPFGAESRQMQLATAVTKQARTYGVAGQVLFNEGANLAASAGYLPGTDTYFYQASQYALMSETDRASEAKRLERVRSFAGSLAPYYEGGMTSAVQMVERYGITTDQALRPVQTLTALAGEFGIDVNRVVDQRRGRRLTKEELYARADWSNLSFDATQAFRATPVDPEERARLEKMSGAYELEDITVADQIAEYAKTLTSHEATMSGNVFSLVNNLGREASVENFRLWEKYDIRTTGDYQAAKAFIDVGEQFGPMSERVQDKLLAASQMQNAYQSNILAQQFIAPMSRAFGVERATDLVSGLGLNDQQMFLAGRMAGGDMRAWSWSSYRGGSLAGRFFDPAGRPIFQSDMRGMAEMVMGQQAMGNPYAQGYDLSGGYNNFIANLTGATGEDLQAWIDGGQIGRDIQHRERMYGYQLEGFDLQDRGMRMQASYLWGGGSWDKPAPGSLWALEDELKALRRGTQAEDFARGRERADLLNQFGIRQEDLGYQRLFATYAFGTEQEQIGYARMAAGHQFQRYQMGYQAQSMQIQQANAREDWAYQDQMTGLNFGWQMEDLDEAIRMSSGRERRKLIRQRERVTLTHNLEGQQIDTTRERQEEAWSREEEYFQKQSEHSEKLMALDVEQFELSKAQREKLFELDKANLDLNREQRETLYALDSREQERRIANYEKEWALQEQIEEKQREYQDQQLKLQEEQAELSKKQAEETYNYQVQVDNVSKTYETITGYFRDWATYDPTAPLAALTSFVQAVQNLPAERVQALTDALTSMNSIDEEAARSTAEVFTQMRHLSPAQLRELQIYMRMTAGQ